MISSTEQFSFVKSASTRWPSEVQAFIRRNNIREFRAVDWNYAVTLLERFAAPMPTEDPFDWCVKNVVFADTEVNGPFDPAGREFLRDIINDIADTETREHTLICSTGTGKTTSVMCQQAWTIVHNPRRAIMVMPATKNAGGSETYVTSRFIPMLEASAAVRDLMPDGQRRFYMNSKKVRLNGSHFDFVGGNSASAISSNRCSAVWMDELDKFKGNIGHEAGTKKLVEERTEGVKDYTVFQNTTPTIESGQGWKCLIRSDFRRRFLPCPHCNSEVRGRDLLARRSLSEANLKGWFDLAWNEQYCVIPSKFMDATGPAQNLIVPRAFMKWDAEAKRRDDSWDKDRIVRSTRLECPHCKGHIRDDHKIWMDKNGVWIPLQQPHGHKGNHLSALYAPPLVTREQDPTHKSLLAGRALKFLDATEDGEGMKAFINSTLAEVDVSQEHATIIDTNDVNFAQEDWTPLMCCDFQKLHPYIWFVIQKWSSFKLHPPFPLHAGKPAFLDRLTPALRDQCEKIVASHSPAWTPLVEILRFDPRTGDFPLLTFLLEKKLTGAKLVTLYRETCGLNTLDLGRWLYREMGRRLPKGGDAEVIAAGHVEWSGDEAWNELREIQQQFKVGEPLRKFNIHPNRALLVDSGYAEKNNPEVLRKCYESGATGRFEWYDPLTKKFEPFKKHIHCRPVPTDCWLPYKGIPTARPRKTAGIDGWKNWAPGDPFYGSSEAEKCAIRILEAASEHYFRQFIEKRQRQKEIRAALDAGKSHRGNIWNVANDCVFIGAQCKRREDFDAQMNSKGINADGEIWERGTGGGGKRKYPDHLLDCASQMQEAHAELLGFFSYERQEKKA